MRRIGRVSLPGLIFFGVLIVAIIVGGGTGTTIVAIAAALLALTLLGAAGGTGVAARDAMDRRGRLWGRPLDDEDPDDRS